MILRNSKIRNIFKKLKTTPLHPQWFAFLHSTQNFKEIATDLNGVVLDIGAGRQEISKFLRKDVRYVPLDYYDTSQNWYQYSPKIYGDASALPIKSESINSVLLLDVLEHLPYPEKCLEEIIRVLKPEGTAIIQVPFLYPLHDEPLDFSRWTQYGLRNLCSRYGFEMRLMKIMGQPVETAAMLFNIAIAKLILQWIKKKSILLILSPFLLLLIFFVNIFGYIGGKYSAVDNFMPHSYRMVLKKK